jgi:hypothetical protein
MEVEIVKITTSFKNAYRPAIILGFLLICILAVMSCGEEKQAIEKDKYEGWTRYTYGHFDLHLSSATPFLADKANLARGFERFLGEICEMLEMPVPEGRIHLFVYANTLEAQKYLDQETPFSNDTAIHWSGVYPYAYQLTKFLLEKKGVPEGKFDVIHEGLAHLLDFSGKNYHDQTNRLVNSAEFVVLSELGDNAVFSGLPLHIQRAESASFVGYLMYNYGLDRIIMLNSSLSGWEESLETMFNMDVGALEKSWLDFALVHSDGS